MISIRRATPEDAPSIVSILEVIVAERIYTAIDRPWLADQQRQYLASLSPREAVHVAESATGAIIGYQSLDLWSPILNSMSHVAQIGTFIHPAWRARGAGKALFQATLDHARKHEFQKFVIQVRSSNLPAQRFYQRLGFRQCGLLSRQVLIAGQEDDEILMEFFL